MVNQISLSGLELCQIYIKQGLISVYSVYSYAYFFIFMNYNLMPDYNSDNPLIH